MKSGMFVGLAAVATLSASGAHAQFYSGNDLHDVCEKSGPICLGYIMGAVDYDQLVVKLAKVPGNMCVPTEATSGQVRDVVKKYLDDHPADRHQTASLLVAVALHAAFPCSR